MLREQLASAADLVRVLGFTERHWIRQAAAGRNADARQSVGAQSS